MKPIKYPLHLFHWHLHDAEGNVTLEVRDDNRVTIFKIAIKGREAQEAKRFMEDIAPTVVRLLNDLQNVRELEVSANVLMPAPESTETASNVPVVASNGNGHIEQQTPKKRGRPFGWRKQK